MATTRKNSSSTLFTLNVELVDTTPLIWRQIVINGDASFAMLHHVIQAAMGWQDVHLHEFRVGNMRIGVPDAEYDEPDQPVAVEKRIRLDRRLAMGSSFTYLYDFGDSWEHRISVEQVRARDDRYNDGPVAGVEAGERACPPEDAGGVGRYQEFVESFESDPYGEETEQMRTWAGLDFDPARFDRPAANAAISRMLSNGWIK
ncbi:plasmid pRiA4b ORF-3 family protein [Candidatus Accumulibacter phosphatis]|uniref:Plasmid pRiA4b ORF-3 family protein n=1 Tax=Candidatus Accumulibacter phosphatis TaxID=327160 RepID=A0ABX1TT64_9PROT|nr:plasmid pRiA4b ORF-3 family protein [Candidatus Accumulibacter sp. ACC012]NMQ26631.1 plasmid pRiA4b ORF-3 family protein [Candidatus Accumulibacter phosphatis]